MASCRSSWLSKVKGTCNHPFAKLHDGVHGATCVGSSVKSFEDIPGPLTRSLPFFGNAWIYRFGGPYKVIKYHDALKDLHRKYGPIVRQNIAGRTIVNLFDPDDVRTVYNVEGKSPVVPPLQETTQLYRQRRNLSLGLGNTNGEEWYRLRAAVQKLMLRPKEVSHYLPLVDSVAQDFVERIEIRKGLTDDVLRNLRKEVALWSLESSGIVCFHRRLGCISGGGTELTAEDMFEANKVIFHNSGLLKFSLPIYKHVETKKWKEILDAEDFFYGKGAEYVNRTIAEIEELTKLGKLDGDKYSFMSHLLTQPELSKKDATIITLSLFGDGLSTTVPALLNNLYLLATNEKVQEKAYKEIKQHKKSLEQPMTIDILNELTYLKAAVKEAFRLLPIGTEVSRIIQKDLVLSGYQVPAGTHVDLNQSVNFTSEKIFDSPLEYRPERWLRDGSNSNNVHPYLLNPFGIGTRMCAGRRFAEQELYVVLSNILLKYQLYYDIDANGKLEQEYHTLLVPNKDLRIEFIPRYY